MSWLDSLFNAGYATIMVAGVALPQQRVVNIVSGATGVDNATLNRTDLTLTGGAPSGAAGGSLGGTYPNPTVVSLEGSGGVLQMTYGSSQWAPGDGQIAQSFLIHVQTTDDGTEVALVLPSFTNGQSRWDCVVTATKAGDGGGVGSLCTSWKADGAFTQRSGATVLVYSNVGAAQGDSSGFTGPTFSASSTNCLLVLDPGGSTIGHVEWVVNLTVTVWL